ncbi:MAG: GlsB/YeaQ/YmgE family stress response membrane protein [Arenibacterium sp.]
MYIVILAIIGAAAGFIATRLMRVEADIPTTMFFGILGALIGGFVLRFVSSLFGFAAGFVGAVLGAMLIIWIWKTYIKK